MVENVDSVEEGFHYDSHSMILVSALLWHSGYRGMKYIFPTKSLEYHCRTMCFLHGLISGFFGINECFVIANPFEHPEWRTTSSEKFLMVFSLGYFLHDTSWCLQYDRKDKLMLAHHAYSIFAMYKMLFKGHSGAQAICALGSMEITNPFLQIRWFLRSEGFYPSTLYTCVEITFMIIFFVVRIVLGTFFLVVIAFQPKNDTDFRILAVVIYTMSWAFMFYIVKYFLHKYVFMDNKANEES